jgi:hypothetical protein
VTNFVRDLPDIPLVTFDDVLKSKFASMLTSATTLILPELQTGNTDNLFQARMLGKELGLLYDRAVDNAAQDRYTGAGYDPPKDANGNIDWAKLQAFATAVLPAALGGLGKLVGGAGAAKALGSGASQLLLSSGSRAVAGGDIQDGYDEAGDLEIAAGDIEEVARACETLIQAARGGQLHPTAVQNAIQRIAETPGLPPAHGDFLSDAAGMIGGLFGGKAGEGIAKGAASLLGGAFKKGASPSGQPAGARATADAGQFQREALRLLRESSAAHKSQGRQLSEIIASNQGNYRRVMNALGLLIRSSKGEPQRAPNRPELERPRSPERESDDPLTRALAT